MLTEVGPATAMKQNQQKGKKYKIIVITIMPITRKPTNKRKNRE